MIQVVYDKIVNFSGVTKIPCVMVGSKCDLSISYVVSFLFFIILKRKECYLFLFSVFFAFVFAFLTLCGVFWRFFFILSL